jgi:hypothetical protein
MGTLGGAVGRGGGIGYEDIRHAAVAVLGVLAGSAGRLLAEWKGVCSSVVDCMEF